MVTLRALFVAKCTILIDSAYFFSVSADNSQTVNGSESYYYSKWCLSVGQSPVKVVWIHTWIVDPELVLHFVAISI